MRFKTRSEDDTLALGRALGAFLRPGDALLLSGDLGAGKSVLARGAARALGVDGPMPSPSFTIMFPYEGRVPVYHFDLYRLVEWPEMADLSVHPCVHAAIRRAAGEGERSVEIETDGVPLDAGALRQWAMDA